MLPGVGISEIVVIAVVALLAFDAEEWPDIMRKLGIFAAHVNRYVQGMWQGMHGK